MWEAVSGFLSNLGKGFMSGASSGLTGEKAAPIGTVGGTIGQLAGQRATQEIGPKAQLYSKLFKLAGSGDQVKTKNPKTGMMGEQSTFRLF